MRVDSEEMAHTRGEGVAGGTPTPSPSGSGQTATHMELTHTDRTGCAILDQRVSSRPLCVEMELTYMYMYC